MKNVVLVAFFLGVVCLSSFAQTTVTSGNWTDPTVWSGGAVPAAAGTVTVSNPLTITSNLSPTGIWTFSSNTTDQPGGTAYFFNPTEGTNTLTVSSGATVTFEAGGANQSSNGANCSGCNQFNSGTIDIYGTLILGSTVLNNSGNLNITIRAGGTLIINGDFVNKNNSGTLTITGALIVNGNFDNATGSVTVGGSGTINTTGTITSTGGSTIFGTTNDCVRGPCSGSSLACSFDNYLSPSAATVCSGSTTITLTSNPITSNAPTSPSYQWKSSTDNITFSNVGTNSASYTTPALTQTTYIKLTITSSTPCTSTSAVATLTVLSSGGGWLGVTSNWGTASNWCSGSLPTSTTDIVITNGTGIANMPVINGGTGAVCRTLTISNTSPATSVTLAASGTASLSIFGDFTNNGTFTDNSLGSTAGVFLAGTTVQSIAGTTANVFNNLTIANTSAATPAINITTNNITVNSNLTMGAGLINLNGYTITLGTAAASTGTLSYTTGTRFYGGNIERWFPTSSITVGTAAGQFPIGTSSDYRPLYLGNGGLSAGGTVKVRHTASLGSTTITSFTDNGGTVSLRSNSFWTVTTANSIGTGTHNLRTEGTGFGTVGAVTDLRQTLANAISPGTDGAHAGSTTNPEVNRTGLTTANLSNSFHWGSINPTATPLPIELLSFTARLTDSHVELNWITASELNNDFFTIERASDIENFEEVAIVKGQGTIHTKSNYFQADESPLPGISYYRLKQTDFDGVFTYSQVRKVENSDTKVNFRVYPNPIVDNKFNFTLTGIDPGMEVPLRIVNLQGASVFEASYKADQSGWIKASVELTSLSTGMYIVIVNASTGLRKKIVIP